MVIIAIAAIAIFALKSYQPRYEPSLSPALGSCPAGKQVYSDRYGGFCENEIEGDFLDELTEECNTYCSSGVASSRYTCYGQLSNLKCITDYPDDHPPLPGNLPLPPEPPSHVNAGQCDCKTIANPTPSPKSSGTPAKKGLA